MLNANRPDYALPDAVAKEQLAHARRINEPFREARAGRSDELRSVYQALLGHVGHSFATSEALSQLAISAALLRRAGEGVPLASHAIVAEPNSGNAWIAYGISLAQSNEFARAVAAFCTTLRVVGWTEATRRTLELIAEDGQGYGDAPQKAAMRTLSDCASSPEARSDGRMK